MYSKKLTKEKLMEYGITNVDHEGHIWIGDKEVPQRPSSKDENHYMQVMLYSPEARQAIPKELRKSSSGQVSLKVHKVCCAWWYGEVPENMVVDHKDEIKYHNTYDNLQIITPAENLERSRKRVRQAIETKSLLHTTEEIKEKLSYYINIYEQTKLNKDAKANHSVRAVVSQWKAKLRYMEEHPELDNLILEKRAAKEAAKRHSEEARNRAKKIKELQFEIDTARAAWEECSRKDSEYYRQMWKDRIQDLKDYKAANPKVATKKIK